MKPYLQLLRPEHWVKNLFVFMPAFFGARLDEPAVLLRVVQGFGAFCLIASAVYALNDLFDAPQDRQHPDKRRRPLASGALTQRQGMATLVVLLAAGLAWSASLGGWFLASVLGYFFLNLLYSSVLKRIALVDVSLIGLGFLLRVYAGGAAAGVPVSQWLTVLTFLLALILGLAKRRGEFVVATGDNHFRRALSGYSLPFLDMSITLCATVAIVAYLMYCLSPEVTERIGSTHIYFTAFFVVLGILRYLQLTLVFNKTESPTRALLRDGFLQWVLLSWVAAFVWLLYLKS